MEGPRVTGDPRDRMGSESGGSTPERWGGGRGLGVEAWSGSGEERGRWSAEETRRRRGATEEPGRGMEGGLGLPAPAAAPSPLCGRPARAGGLRGLRAHGPAHVPSRAGR